MSWDVTLDEGTCADKFREVAAELTHDFGALQSFPRWTDDVGDGAASLHRSCRGVQGIQRAIRLCCAEASGHQSKMVLVGVTLALEHDGQPADGLTDSPPPIPRPAHARHPNSPPLPPIPMSDLPPVQLGPCQLCPPAKERYASPVVLEIERTPCGEGVCPGLAIRLHSDGTLEFFGRFDVQEPRYCVAKADPKRVTRILSAARGSSKGHSV